MHEVVEHTLALKIIIVIRFWMKNTTAYNTSEAKKAILHENKCT